MSVTALVPIKERHRCKTRLAPQLSERERLQLVRYMLDHVLATLQQLPAIERLLVLSPQRDQLPDTITRLPERGRDLNSSLRCAVEDLRQQGAGKILILPADLPWLQPEDVNALLTAADTGLAIAPSDDGRGTNGLCLPAGASLPFCFGDNSLAAHLQQARHLGLSCRQVRRRGLGFDLDTPADWRRWHTQSDNSMPPGEWRWEELA